jgi:type IV pilus assembly protein PilC
MPKFAWQGRTKSGKVEKGVMEAADAEAVMAKLRASNIIPLEGSVKPQGLDFNMELNIPGFEPKVKDKDIIIFTRQFATMIDAGLPLVQCLDLLATEMENRTFKKVLFEVKETVEAGSTFADALAKHPKVFDNLYVNMVAAGEAGGILDVIQQRLAKHMEKAIRLKKKIKGAMIYPASIVGIAVVVMAVLMIWVIPVFAQMFSDFGGQLPGPTRLVLGASNFMVAHVWTMLISVIVAGFAIKRTYKTEKGRREMDRFSLKVPVFGDLIRKAAVAKFTRTLGTLISSGVPILDGLQIVAATAGNKVVEEAIMHARSSISEGKDVAEPLGQSKVFPPMVVQMIAVGEATGAMDTMLSKIADFYDDEVDEAVAALTSMLEPMLMVFLGVTIGFIVVAMYLPIFEMASVVGG